MSATSVMSGWLRGKREEMQEEEEEEGEEGEEEAVVVVEDEVEEYDEDVDDGGRLRGKHDDCTSMSMPTIPTYNHHHHHHHHSSVGGVGGMWAKTAGSRAAVGRLKSRLFETRLVTHVKQAHIAITDSLKQAGWAVEHKVSEVSRRGWSEATRAWGSGGAGGGTLALTGGSSGGPHERSSLLLGPGDGYQRLDNNKSNDGWGDDSWTSDWGNGNNSNASSPVQTRMESPNARNAKKNNNNSSNKSKGSVKNKGNAEEELLVDLNSGNGSGGGNKGHTWDNWDDDWEKIDGQ